MTARLFKGYASAHGANTVQCVTVRRKQKRTLRVDFNGALPAGTTIESVRFDCTAPWSTYMSNPVRNERDVAVDVEFNFGGRAFIKATATDSEGTEQNYEFEFFVADAPLYPGAEYSSAQGPFTVTA